MDLATLWARLHVDEALAGNVRVGQEAEIRLRSVPGRSYRGRVTRIDIESHRVSEERRVYVTFEEPLDRFHLGGQTEALITVSRLDQAHTSRSGILITNSAVIIALIITLIITTMTMDKVREIATLKLIGAPDRIIVGLIVKQALLMAAMGLIFGAILLTCVKDYFPRRVMMLSEDGMLLGVVGLGVCLPASGLDVRLALKIDPAQALGG